jgi:UDP-glucose 4-epimerase
VKVLVTGGAGYVGGVSVDTLIDAGHEVVVLDDLTTGHAAIVNPAARLARGSYGDEAATRALLVAESIDAILHCAARSLVGESLNDPAKYYRDNVAGGIALLEAARAAGVRRVVFSSTAAVYGVPDNTPIQEDDALRPINTYGETKRTFEGALRWYGHAYGFRSVILRYFNVAGATERLGEIHRPETHLIPNVLIAAEGGPPLTLFGDDYPTPDGTPIRDYIHVSDLADAHLAALLATDHGDARMGPVEGACAPLVCNLGTSSGFSVRDVLRTAAAITGGEIPYTVGPRRPGDPPVLVAANARAGEVLGWSPRRSSLDEMIGSAWAWRRAHPAGYGD